MIRGAVQLVMCAAVLAAAACSGQEASVEAVARAEAHADGGDHSVATVGHAAADSKRQSGHDTHSYVPPDIAQMTGKISLVNAKTGATFTEQDLLGSWTLLYMGYIECLEACPMAMASIPQAVDKLAAMGIPAKAVFIDINAPRLDDLSGGTGHSATDAGAHGGAHGGAGDVPVNELTMTGPEVRRQAIAKWGEKQDPDVILLSGSRKQVMDAGRLFKSRAEQTMMPTKEAIHHINHTTYIYALNPKGEVVVLLYHSDSPQLMVDEVVAVSKAAPTGG